MFNSLFSYQRYIVSIIWGQVKHCEGRFWSG